MINYLTYFNYGYLDFAKNSILNFLNTIKEPSILHMACLDTKSYPLIYNFITTNNINNIFLYNYNIDIFDSADFNNKNFFSITHKKIQIILDFINKYEILHFFDTDVVFVQDPTEIIMRKIKDHDLVFQQDAPRSHNHELYHNYVCTGNFTIKKNDKTISLIQKILNNCKINPNKNDQEILYEYLNSYCTNIKLYPNCNLDIYDPDEFQNGFDSFQANFHLKTNKISIHANHMIGREQKKAALQSIGAWWLVNEK